MFKSKLRKNGRDKITPKPIFNLDDNSWQRKTITDRAIVLDLDNTLIHTFDDIESMNKLGIYKKNNNQEGISALKSRIYRFCLEDCDIPGMGEKDDHWGVMRPGLHGSLYSKNDFIAFCFNYFRFIVIFSAGTKNYVEAIVKAIFTEAKMQPHAVFYREFVEKGYDSEEEEDEDNHHPVKPLEMIINSHEVFRENLSLKNILALDDIDTTFEKNPNNGILIPEFTPKPTLNGIRKDDNSLDLLTNWLMRKDVIESEDVRNLDKNTIFV